LTGILGGLTAFSRSPAQGTTMEGGSHDEIVVFEAMTETLDVSSSLSDLGRSISGVS
jgi:hypothetical protein